MSTAMTSGDETARARAREEELWDAFRANDRTRLMTLIHEDALDAGPAGVLDRDAVLDAVARMEIAGFELHEFRLRSLGDVEVVTYRSTVDGSYAGKPFPAPVVYVTTVWFRSAGDWVVVHRHEAAARA
jgi:ketosteroid isomerase-like protein